MIAAQERLAKLKDLFATDMKTAFLRSGRHEDFLCIARVLKLGQRCANGTAECNSVASGLLAHHVAPHVKVTT